MVQIFGEDDTIRQVGEVIAKTYYGFSASESHVFQSPRAKYEYYNRQGWKLDDGRRVVLDPAELSLALDVAKRIDGSDCG